jgi:hypothetical protein
MANRDWDLTSNNSLQAAAGWILRKSEAMLVVIIRPDDMAISAHGLLAPKDSTALLEDRMPELHERLQAERVKAREAAEREHARALKKARGQ